MDLTNILNEEQLMIVKKANELKKYWFDNFDKLPENYKQIFINVIEMDMQNTKILRQMDETVYDEYGLCNFEINKLYRNKVFLPFIKFFASLFSNSCSSVSSSSFEG